MLGTFDLSLFGRFVVSGETPEELLWDLFDQSVLGSSTVLAFAGARIAIPNRDGGHLDADDRKQLRHSPDWAALHSAYFGDIIAEGNLVCPIALPSGVFFTLHCARLVGLVANRTYSSYRSMGYNTLMMLKHGPNTPECAAALAQAPQQGYPYGDYDPINVLNYFQIKGILKLESAGAERPAGLLSDAEVESCIALEKKAIQDEKDELKRLALESAQKPRRKATPRKPSS